MKAIKLIFAAGALSALAGCVAVPVQSGYGYYDPAPAYYYGPPAYYGPSIGIGIYGGGGHYYHGHGYRGYRYR
jgi:hypothetical protein